MLKDYVVVFDAADTNSKVVSCIQVKIAPYPISRVLISFLFTSLIKQK